MLSDKEKLEYDMLGIIREARQAIGCGAICAQLQENGYSISEATVGRLLRDLDRARYTDKAGFQGRTLSAAGMDRLSQLASKQRGMQWGVEFAAALQGHTKEQLLEVLVARRAIESELAALAAANATIAEVEKLDSIIEEQRQTIAAGGAAAQLDVDFHALIAQMARNRVLMAAVALIRQDDQLSPVLEHIRKQVNSAAYIDHRKIYQGIAGHSPVTARQAMTEHIDKLIDDVEKYYQA